MRILQLGCGVVGSAYLEAFHREGTHDIVGGDVSDAQIKAMRGRGLPCKHVRDLEGPFDAILVSVPTPLEDDRLSMRYVDSTVETCARHVADDGIVLIRSTVTPGYSADYERRLNAKRGGAADRPCVGFSPEYLRAHTAVRDARNPWVVVIGADDDVVTRRCRAVFAPFSRDCEVRVLSRSEAELQKLVHNHFNALKISYGNAIAELARSLDPNIDTVRVLKTVALSAESIRNPVYGFRKVDAPFNGTCLTKDPQHLASLCPPSKRAGRALLQSVVDVNASLRGTKYDTHYAGCYSDMRGTEVATSATVLRRQPVSDRTAK